MTEKNALLIYESRGKWVVIDFIESVVSRLNGIFLRKKNMFPRSGNIISPNTYTQMRIRHQVKSKLMPKY